MKNISRAVLLMFFAALISPAAAANLTGVVREASADTATVETSGDVLPAVGDKVEIFFELAGTDTEVSVATGHVQEAAPGKVVVKIENATGTIEANQRARFTSKSSQKSSGPSEPASSPTSSQPESAASSMTEEKVRAALSGKWAAKTGEGLQGTVIFKGDGAVVVPLADYNREGAEAGFVSAKYKIDAASNPPRVVITNVEIMPPPQYTEEELKRFQEHIDWVRKFPRPGDLDIPYYQRARFLNGPVKEALLRSTWIGEMDDPAHIRIQGFDDTEAAGHPQLGPTPGTLTKLGPSEKALLADFHYPSSTPSPSAAPTELAAVETPPAKLSPSSSLTNSSSPPSLALQTPAPRSLPPPSPPNDGPDDAVPGAHYAAIAYSPTTGKWGSARNYKSKNAAMAHARSECGQSDAPTAWCRNAWVALAISDKQPGVFGSTWGTTANAARQAAKRECLKRSSDARVVLCVSSSGK